MRAPLPARIAARHTGATATRCGAARSRARRGRVV